MRQINRDILHLAIPAIVSNITTPVLSIIDTAIVGHIGSAVYIGAIAVGGSMLNLVYWLMNFLRMGSSGLTAQAYGAHRLDRSYAVLWRGLTVGAIAAIVLWLLAVPVCKGMLIFMDADATTSALASKYFYIVITGAPAVMANYAISGWFLGMQDSRTPMWMALITNVVNIIVSLTLVIGVGMKIEGVAIGTACAQWAGLAFALWQIRRRYRANAPGRVKVFEKNEFKHFFSINTDIFMRTACLVAVTLWFTRTGAHQSTEMLAANALLMQFFLFFSYFMDGFAFAAEALSGKYHGASDAKGLRANIQAIFRWGLWLSVGFSLLYLVGTASALGWLTDNCDVIATARRFIIWVALIPLASFGAFVWDGIYTGMTLTRRMAKSMLVAMMVFFLGCFTLIPLLGNHGLWVSFILYLLSRSIAQTLMFKEFGK